MNAKNILFLMGVAVFAAFSSSPVSAATKSVDLRVEDPIRQRVVSLALDQMKTLGWETLTTDTPWTNRRTVFGGVPLGKLLAHAGITAGTVQAVALNDYQATIDVAQAVAWDAFVACEAEGAPMPVREKGPCWIVFPWSERPELDRGDVLAISVWQLHVLRAR